MSFRCRMLAGAISIAPKKSCANASKNSVMVIPLSRKRGVIAFALKFPAFMMLSF
ncbi:hypothetical protein D3C79_1076460 [compost metagenome]